jgi:hypothetical protein
MIIMKLLKSSILCALLLGLVGCSTCHDDPGHVFRLVVYDKDELVANDQAVYKAVSLCDARGLQAKLLDHVSTYIGMNCEQKQLTIKAQRSFNDRTIKTVSDHDYRVTLRFICVPPPLTGKEYCKYARCRADRIANGEDVD